MNDQQLTRSNCSCGWSVDLLHSLFAHRQGSIKYLLATSLPLFSSSWLLSPVNLYLSCVCALRRVWLFATPWTVAHQAPLYPWDFPGKNTGVGCISSSQGSSWPRDQTCISCICCTEGRFSTCWAIRATLPGPLPAHRPRKPQRKDMSE